MRLSNLNIRYFTMKFKAVRMAAAVSAGRGLPFAASLLTSSPPNLKDNSS